MGFMNGDFRTPGINPNAEDPYLAGTQGTMLERRDARKRMQQYNPLSQFGFMSQNEREQAEAMAEQQDRQNMMLLASMDPLKAQVYRAQMAGRSMGKAVNSMLTKGHTSSTGDDPEVEEFNKLVQANDGDVAKAYITMGKTLVKRGDQRGIQMIQAGRKLQAEQSKADLDNLKTAQEIGFAKTGKKLGDLEMFIDGESQVQKQVTGFEEDGTPIWSPVGSGPRSPKQTIQNMDDPRTAPQEGTAYQKTIDKGVHLKGAFDDIDYIRKIAKDNPLAIGPQGKLVGMGYNLYQAAKIGMEKGFINKTPDTALSAKVENAESAAVQKTFNFSNLEKAGQIQPTVKAMYIRLAYGLAAASEQGGRTISDRDVQNMLDSLGQGVADPKSLDILLTRIKYTLARDFVNTATFNSQTDKPEIAGLMKFFQGELDSVDKPSTSPTGFRIVR